MMGGHAYGGGQGLDQQSAQSAPLHFNPRTDLVPFMVNMLTEKGAPTSSAQQVASYIPVVNPMTAINPVYTQQAAVDSLAPMRDLQAYRQTGQIVEPASTFKPYTPPPPAMVAVNTGSAGGAK